MKRTLMISLLVAGVSSAATAGFMEYRHGAAQKAAQDLVLADAAVPVSDKKAAAISKPVAAVPVAETEVAAIDPMASGIAYDKPLLGAPLAGSTGIAGRFLASQFAQNQYDWKIANKFLGDIIARDQNNAELIKRSMVLAMGHGDYPLAAERAAQLVALEGGNSLALLFLAVDALSKGEHSEAALHLEAMPAGDMSDFIKPLLRGWIDAGQGRKFDEGFNETSIHLYHAALIAMYLNDNETARHNAHLIMEMGALSLKDIERVADLFAAIGEKAPALSAYDELLKLVGGKNKHLEAKIRAVNENDEAALKQKLPPLRIASPAQGAALTMFDMAYILFQEGSDNSAKLFANMTLALDPNVTEAQILLADTLARNGRYDEAVAYLMAVPPEHASYLSAQRHAAELLAEAERLDEALALLEKLFTENNDVESLIRIGDLYRMNEKYPRALQAYNRAATHIGDQIPEEFWHLLYARGMVYEREGEWSKAEADLKAAMVFRPDHPYLLNYLGYGWADQGINLEESLALIEKAVMLRPGDGHIIDSLGWVQYMMGMYEEAIPNLERAVELLPYDAVINDHLGDAYWQGGRRLEARFQWERALNASDDEELSAVISQKLRYGLEKTTVPVKHARSDKDSAVSEQ